MRYFKFEAAAPGVIESETSKGHLEGERGMKVHIRKSTIKKIRKSGFRARMKTRGGRKVLSRRRFQGKKRLTNV